MGTGSPCPLFCPQVPGKEIDFPYDDHTLKFARQRLFSVLAFSDASADPVA